MIFIKKHEKPLKFIKNKFDSYLDNKINDLDLKFKIIRIFYQKNIYFKKLYKICLPKKDNIDFSIEKY